MSKIPASSIERGCALDRVDVRGSDSTAQAAATNCCEINNRQILHDLRGLQFPLEMVRICFEKDQKQEALSLMVEIQKKLSLLVNED